MTKEFFYTALGMRLSPSNACMKPYLFIEDLALAIE